MILTAHQPMFMPWLGLFAKIAQADQFVVFDDVPFERHGFGNRNYIKTHTGIQLLTVPLHLKGHLDIPIRQLQICNEMNWRRKHIRAIEIAYRKAPFYERYMGTLRTIYSQEWNYLAGLNRALLDWFLRELEIFVPVLTASEMGFAGSKSDLVLDMCKQCGATEYIFGSQGRDYADVDAFARAGVTARFQDFEHPTYPQQHGAFVERMSVLDLLMNCGPDSRRIING